MIVDAFVDVWVAYTLLALEYASSDSLANVDPTPLAQPEIDQQLVWNLHTDAIIARAAPSEQELRRRYEDEQPYSRVWLRHILLRLPSDASEATVDSVRRLAERLYARLQAGADFVELARSYSDDPSSARRGGDMGWVPRGRLVPEVEELAFNLEPGTISEPVRTGFGYHIVKVIEHDTPDFESMRKRYLREQSEGRIARAEREYIDSLRAAAGVRFAPGAEQLVRRLALEPRLERLGPAERDAIVLRYRGGAVTVGELADLFLRTGANLRRSVSGWSDEQVRTFLREDILRNELLVKAARDLGYTLRDPTVDSLTQRARRSFYAAGTLAGFRADELRGTDDEAVRTAVDSVVVQILTRRRSPQPAERIWAALRESRPHQVYPDRFQRVATRAAELRSAARGGSR